MKGEEIEQELLCMCTAIIFASNLLFNHNHSHCPCHCDFLQFPIIIIEHNFIPLISLEQWDCHHCHTQFLPHHQDKQPQGHS